MANHPVVADGTLGFQSKNLVQLARRRLASVIILWLGRLTGKTSVVLR
jgi:hypothetical protein